MPRLPRPVIQLAFSSLFADISTEMLYQVLPLFITRELGAPAGVVGVIEGVAEATQNIVQGGSGWLADRSRRNKPLALVGYGIAALAKPAMGLAVVWPHVLAGRFMDRLGTGIRSAPRDALIASSVEESRRGAAFGLEGLGDNLGAVIGPLIAAGLLYVLHADLRVVFFFAFVPGLFAFSLVGGVREAAPPPRARERGRGIRRLPRDFWRYLIAIGLFGIGNSSRSFVILKAAATGLGPEQTLLVYAGYNLVAALVSYPAGELSDAWGRKRLLLGAFAVFAFAYVGLAFATSALLVSALFILNGVHYGTFRAVGKSFAVDLVPSASRGTGIGLYGATVGLSALFASTLAGQLWDRVGPGATFGYGAACAVGGAILLMILVPSRR